MEKTKIQTARQTEILNAIRSNPNASYTKIGRIFGISRQRVHQIAQKAELPPRKRRGGLGRPPRGDITVEKITELLGRGFFLGEIAEILNCGPRTIQQRLRQGGIKRPLFPPRGDVTVEKVLELYIEEGMPISSIAQVFRCNIKTVEKRLKRADIGPKKRIKK